MAQAWRAALLVAAPAGPQRSAILESIARTEDELGSALPVIVADLEAAGNAAEHPGRDWTSASWGDLGGPDLPIEARPAYAGLASYRLGAADSVLVLGPGSRLLRQVGLGDLVWNQSTPYAFRTEERDLRVEGQPWLARRADVQTAADVLGVPIPRTVASRGPAHIVCDRAAALAESFDLASLVRAVPDAGLWFDLWLRKLGDSDVAEREPIFKSLLSPGERLEARFLMESLIGLARGYVGVQLPPPNAVWEDPAPRKVQLRSLVPRAMLIRSAVRRVYGKFPSLHRFVPPGASGGSEQA